jgi:endonuclease YncB( thermonuclease family)
MVADGRTPTCPLTVSDRYDRVLAFMWVDQVLVNDTLVREGFAHQYTYDGADKSPDLLVIAEAQALSRSRGLWAADTALGTPSKPLDERAPPSTPAASSLHRVTGPGSLEPDA